jgi:ATP-dependent Clp protease protease subunit
MCLYNNNNNTQIMPSSIRRRRYKYKYKNEDTDDEEDVDDGSAVDEMSLIRVMNNHIYFYDTITNLSSLKLNMTLKKLIEESLIHSIKNDCDPVPIKLHMNSPGGEIVGAFCVINTIEQSKVPIHTIIEGEAASAATMISVVGHKRYINRNAHMLIHQIRAGFLGKMDECQDEMKNIKRYSKLAIKIYKKYTNLTDVKLEKILKKELYWGCKTCLKYGLVDEIL